MPGDQDGEFAEGGEAGTGEAIHLVEVFLGVFIGAVTFTGSDAGTYSYGSTAASVPESIRHWIMCRINTMYEYREAFVAGTFDDKPGAFIDGLLDPYRIVSAH